MTEENKDSLTYGQFVRQTVTGPVVEVDCATHMAEFGEEFTMGDFVSPTVKGPATNPENAPKPYGRFAPLNTPRLQLDFSVNPDLGLTPEAVMARVVPILELVSGCGFTWDRTNSGDGPGRIGVQFVPTSSDAVARMPWLKDKLTPVLANIREVSNPEWNEIPPPKA